MTFRLHHHFIEKTLSENGYQHPKFFVDDGRVAAIWNMIYTVSIVLMNEETILFGYEDRWCYHTAEAAKAALDAWDGTGEPNGWHRHPASGRRVREDGTIEVRM